MAEDAGIMLDIITGKLLTLRYFSKARFDHSRRSTQSVLCKVTACNFKGNIWDLPKFHIIATYRQMYALINA